MAIREGCYAISSNLQWRLYRPVPNSGSQSGVAQFYQSSVMIVENVSFHVLHIYTYTFTMLLVVTHYLWPAHSVSAIQTKDTNTAFQISKQNGSCLHNEETIEYQKVFCLETM